MTPFLFLLRVVLFVLVLCLLMHEKNNERRLFLILNRAYHLLISGIIPQVINH